MMKFMRIAAVLIGLFMLVNGLGFWFKIETMNPLFGLATQSDLGFASIRADFGGFFLAVATFSIYAAWKVHGPAALAAAVLFYIAMVGRLVSIAIDGVVEGGIGPMLFELVCGSILLWIYLSWRTPRPVDKHAPV